MGIAVKASHDAAYSVYGPAGDLLDSLRGQTAVVCGSAETVFQDVNYALDKIQGDRKIFAVNDVGMYLPVVDHWVSLHADKLKGWIETRRREPSLWQEFTTHTSFSAIWSADYVWQIEPCHFSLSGYFAMQLAYLMGAEKIVLCGCPGDGTRRFFDHKARDDYHYGGGTTVGDQRDRTQLLNEMNRVPDLKFRVRSMSGWSREYFGGL